MDDSLVFTTKLGLKMLLVSCVLITLGVSNLAFLIFNASINPLTALALIFWGLGWGGAVLVNLKYYN